MTVLDSFAAIALLRGEPASEQVARLLRDTPHAALTALGVVEVLDHLVRLAGADEDDAALDVAQLGLADPIPVDAELATRAGFLRARHYHRRTRAISAADCVAAEAARRSGSALATADPHLLETCMAERIAFVALADSDGAIWTP